MDKFEEKEMKKIRPIKNTWYDCLINYNPDPVRKSVGGFKDKVTSLFKTNTPTLWCLIQWGGGEVGGLEQLGGPEKIIKT